MNISYSPVLLSNESLLVKSKCYLIVPCLVIYNGIQRVKRIVMDRWRIFVFWMPYMQKKNRAFDIANTLFLIKVLLGYSLVLCLFAALILSNLRFMSSMIKAKAIPE